MVSLYVTAAVAGGVLAIPLVLLHVFKVPKFPSRRVKAFLEKSASGPIAHRGGFPENTLAAFKQSKALGASSVEVDLGFTKDGHAVLLHDYTVDRTSDGRGLLGDLTLEEVRKLDFGYKFGPEFTGERIPTLSEAVDLCEELDLLLFLDAKGDATKSLAAVQKLFAERPHLYDRVAVVSFWPRFLYKLRLSDTSVICGLTVRSDVLLLWPDGSRKNKEWWKHLLAHPLDIVLFWSLDKWIWKLLGVSMLLLFKNDVLGNRVDLQKWRERDVSVIVWTVNRMDEKDYFRNVLKLQFMTDIHVDGNAPRPERYHH